MDDPLISAIIPCYNGSAFLRDSVRSVLEQRVPCEVIMVDDGSTDDSLDRARFLMREYPGSAVLAAQPNQGPAAARNTGLRLARGKYVCFLDVDDQYAPGFFTEALRLLENDPAVAAIFCQVELVQAH